MTPTVVHEAIADIRAREELHPPKEQALARLEADDTPALWAPILKRLAPPTAARVRPVVWAITYSAHRATLGEAFDVEGQEAELGRLKSCATALERYFEPIAKRAVQNKELFGETMRHLALLRAVLDTNLTVSRLAIPFVTTLSREDNVIAAFHFFLCEELQALCGLPLYDFVSGVATIVFETDCNGRRARANHKRESQRRADACLGRLSLSTDPHYSASDWDGVVLTTG